MHSENGTLLKRALFSTKFIIVPSTEHRGVGWEWWQSGDFPICSPRGEMGFGFFLCAVNGISRASADFCVWAFFSAKPVFLAQKKAFAAQHPGFGASRAAFIGAVHWRALELFYGGGVRKPGNSRSEWWGMGLE